MAVAEPPPLAGVTYFTQQPDEALHMISIDRRTAIATCTHGHDLDQEAFVAALRSDACSVGALGSERRRTARLAALRVGNVGEVDLARLRTPIGLPIGRARHGRLGLQRWRKLWRRRARPCPGRSAADHERRRDVSRGRTCGGSQFGGSKLTAKWQGGALLESAFRVAREAPVDSVVVLGAHSAEVGNLVAIRSALPG